MSHEMGVQMLIDKHNVSSRVYGNTSKYFYGLCLYKQFDLKMYDKIHGPIGFDNEYLEYWVEKRHLHICLLSSQST